MDICEARIVLIAVLAENTGQTPCVLALLSIGDGDTISKSFLSGGSKNYKNHDHQQQHHYHYTNPLLQ
jgi:hypothetical protein